MRCGEIFSKHFIANLLLSMHGDEKNFEIFDAVVRWLLAFWISLCMQRVMSAGGGVMGAPGRLAALSALHNKKLK